MAGNVDQEPGTIRGSSGAEYVADKKTHDGQPFGSNYTDALGERVTPGNEIRITPRYPDNQATALAVEGLDIIPTRGVRHVEVHGKISVVLFDEEKGPHVIASGLALTPLTSVANKPSSR